jgi:O-antigen/teichoic acid export membrane protein
MGVLLAALTVSFNIYFIPRYGLSGAAYATALAVICYNTLKLIFVWKKMRLQPFGRSSFMILLIGVITYVFGSISVDLGPPLVSIFFKSLLITVVFGGLIWFLDISPEFNQIIGRYLKIKRPRK